jgi:hypothetical protein
MPFSPASCYLGPFSLTHCLGISYHKDMVERNCAMDSSDLQLRPVATCAHVTDVEHNMCSSVSGLLCKQVRLFGNCGEKGTVMLIGPLKEPLLNPSACLINPSHSSTIVLTFRDHTTSNDASLNTQRHAEICTLHCLTILGAFIYLWFI